MAFSPLLFSRKVFFRTCPFAYYINSILSFAHGCTRASSNNYLSIPFRSFLFVVRYTLRGTIPRPTKGRMQKCNTVAPRSFLRHLPMNGPHENNKGSIGAKLGWGWEAPFKRQAWHHGGRRLAASNVSDTGCRKKAPLKFHHVYCRQVSYSKVTL